MAVTPGDLLVTRSKGTGSFLIRLGAALRDRPNLVNHVAVVHHMDANGVTWCIEGRPGGVGWRDARDYLKAPYTVTNASQPKSAEQRATVVEGAAALLGTPYDWAAICQDAAGAFGLDDVWQLRWGRAGTVPGHVVCSSLAAWLYSKAELECPPGDREVTPADWLAMWIQHDWDSKP